MKGSGFFVYRQQFHEARQGLRVQTDDAKKRGDITDGSPPTNQDLRE